MGISSKVAAGALGRITQASKTAQQTTITAVVDVAGLSVTFTALAGRRYLLSLECLMFSATADDVVQCQITDNANTVLQLAQGISRVVNVGVSLIAEIEVVPGAGSVTYKARALRASGAGNVTFDCGATYPATLRVTDIGT